MASANWIPLYITPRSAEIQEMAAQTGASPEHVFACVVRWFWHCDQEMDSGRSDLSPEAFHAVAEWRQPKSNNIEKDLFSAMCARTVRWLRLRRDGTVFALNYEKHFSTSAKRRAKHARNTAKKRAQAVRDARTKRAQGEHLETEPEPEPEPKTKSEPEPGPPRALAPERRSGAPGRRSGASAQGPPRGSPGHVQQAPWLEKLLDDLTSVFGWDVTEADRNRGQIILLLDPMRQDGFDPDARHIACQALVELAMQKVSAAKGPTPELKNPVAAWMAAAKKLIAGWTANAAGMAEGQ